MTKTRELTEYNQLEADLAELLEQSKALVFDYEDKKGNKDARSYVYSIRQKRAELEKVRVGAKAAAVEHSKKVDAKAKDIDGKLMEMINVHQGKLDEIKKREEKRIDTIKRKIEYIEQCAATIDHRGQHYNSEQLKVRMADLQNMEIDEEAYEEFTEQATSALGSSILILNNGIQAAELREENARELKRLKEDEDRRKREAEQQEQPELDPDDVTKAADAVEGALEDGVDEVLHDINTEPHSGIASRPRPQRTAADDCRDKNREALEDLMSNGIDDDTAKQLITLIFQGKIRHISINY